MSTPMPDSSLSCSTCRASVVPDSTCAHHPDPRLVPVRGYGIYSWICIALALLIVRTITVAAESYSPTEIVPGDGGDFYPATGGLNDHGEVVGTYYPSVSLWRAAVWRDDTLTQLPLLPQTTASNATAINNLGMVVGDCVRFVNGSEVRQACFWDSGGAHALPSLPGTTSSSATGINNHGGIVGWATSPHTDASGQLVQRRDAVIWQGGDVYELEPPLAGAETYAPAIDDSGRVAANWYQGSSSIPARWSPISPNGSTGTMSSLETSVLYAGGGASGINQEGTIVGYDNTYWQQPAGLTDWQQVPVVWHGTAKTLLPMPSYADYGYAIGINNKETIVGYLIAVEQYEENTWADYVACVWDAVHGIRDLNTLVASAMRDTMDPFVAAKAINNYGQILVETSSSGGYVLLTPSNLPPTPAGLSAYGEVSRVTLQWSPVAGAEGYHVKRATASGGPYATVAENVAFTQYVDESVVNNTKYYYVVTAVGEHGESIPSREASATPGIPAPHWLGALGGVGKVDLHWGAVSGVLSYRVKRSTVSGGPYITIATASGVPLPIFSDTTVSNGTRYYYVVSAVGGGTESLNSSEATAVPQAPPLAPRNLTATGSKAKVQLKWIQSSSVGVVKNTIYRATTAAGPYTRIATISSGTSYVDDIVSRKQTYYYTVRAVNANDTESQSSNAASAMPK